MPPPNTARPQVAQPPPPDASTIATRGDEDPQSPTVQLQSYLRSRGMPLTSQNMQRLLEANARGAPFDPNSQNVVPLPGLVNDVPSTDPAVGQPGNVAGKVETAPSRPLPVPPAYVAPPDAQPPVNLGNDADATRGLPNLGAMIAAGAGVGTGMWAGSKYFNRGGAPTAAPTPQGTTVNVEPPTGPPPAANAAPAGVPPPNATPAPVQAQTGDRFGTQPPPTAPDELSIPPSPMEQAFRKAMAPNPTSMTRPPMPVGPTSPVTGPVSTAPDTPVVPPTGPPRLVEIPGGNGAMWDTRAGIMVRPNPAVRALQPPVRVPPGAVRVPRLNLR